MQIPVARFKCRHPDCVRRTKDYSVQTVFEHVAQHLLKDTSHTEHYTMGCSCKDDLGFCTIPYATFHLDQEKNSNADHRIVFRDDVSREDIGTSRAFLSYLDRFIGFKDYVLKEDNSPELRVLPVNDGDIVLPDRQEANGRPSRNGFTMFGQIGKQIAGSSKYSQGAVTPRSKTPEPRSHTPEAWAAKPKPRSQTPEPSGADRHKHPEMLSAIPNSGFMFSRDNGNRSVEPMGHWQGAVTPRSKTPEPRSHTPEAWAAKPKPRSQTPEPSGADRHQHPEMLSAIPNSGFMFSRDNGNRSVEPMGHWQGAVTPRSKTPEPRSRNPEPWSCGGSIDNRRRQDYNNHRSRSPDCEPRSPLFRSSSSPEPCPTGSRRTFRRNSDRHDFHDSRYNGDRHFPTKTAYPGSSTRNQQRSQFSQFRDPARLSNMNGLSESIYDRLTLPTKRTSNANRLSPRSSDCD